MAAASPGKLVSETLPPALGSTYCCKALLSTLKAMKLEQYVTPTNGSLIELFRCATTLLMPNFKALAPQMQVYNKYTEWALVTPAEITVAVS